MDGSIWSGKATGIVDKAEPDLYITYKNYIWILMLFLNYLKLLSEFWDFLNKGISNSCESYEFLFNSFSTLCF